MLRKIAELHLNKQVDPDGEILKTLEEKGFTVVETGCGLVESHYFIAKEIKEE